MTQFGTVCKSRISKMEVNLFSNPRVSKKLSLQKRSEMKRKQQSGRNDKTLLRLQERSKDNIIHQLHTELPRRTRLLQCVGYCFSALFELCYGNRYREITQYNHFYRAMHFSAKRGLAIARRPSVCL